MIIVSKDRDSIVNMDQVTNLFVGNDEYTVKAAFANGGGSQIGRYNAPVATEVIKMIGQAAERSTVYFMPDDEAVAARINQYRQEWERHHATGKKTKGHGGS